MSLVRRVSVLVGLAALIALAVPLAAPSFGKEKADDAAKSASPQPEETAEPDPFVVPDGSPEELMEYLKKVQKMRPEPGSDRRAQILFMVKLARSVWQASDKILASDKATDEQKTAAAKSKFGALGFLSRVGSKEAADAMKMFPEQLTKLGLDDLARMAKSQLLLIELAKSIRKLPGASPLDTVLDEIKRQVADNPDKRSFPLAYQTVSNLQSLEDTEKVASLCDDFVKLYSASDAPGMKDMVERIEAIGRRMRLVGHPMKVEGVLLDGKPFDWSAYKGKVVLVQFWATWCGFCVKEIPNIERCYDKYHDQGFDVVAISLDRDRADLDEFLADNKLPWPILYKEGERNATADYYGVTGLPTLILVGKDGNVVSLNARGSKLNKALRDLLGPAEEKEEESPADKAKL